MWRSIEDECVRILQLDVDVTAEKAKEILRRAEIEGRAWAEDKAKKCLKHVGIDDEVEYWKMVWALKEARKHGAPA